MEYRFITPQGKVTWLKGNAVSMHDKDGNITGYSGTITDINARKLVLERLQELANLDGLTQVGNRYSERRRKFLRKTIWKQTKNR